ncbi:hypothetical protein DH2020_024772 [Rehmannia glutinosa]|uniref:F-box domain-containing protein n=1 Tax=Rehmannia glutinosa TaxID=99300 RepID=A0ABR0W3B7_REHGL
MNSTRMWNDKLIYDIFEPEDAKAITSIPLSAIRVEDKLIWNFAKDGRYTVKSGYKLAKMDMENRNSASSTSGSKGDRKWLWHLNIPQKFSSSHGIHKRQMQGHQPHPATPISDAAFLIKRGKKRGNYNCGRCGLPKKGHKCPFTTDNDDVSTTPVSTPAAAAGDSSIVTTLSCASAVAAGKVADTSPPSVVRPMMPASRRRALSFDDLSVADSIDELEEERFDLEEDLDLDGSGKLPGSCLWEVLMRLPPAELLSAARVCRGWRETTRKLWRAAEELRLRVPAKAQIGFVGSVLQKCPGLLRLSLRIESDVDATMLACIAFSCPNLQSLEIFTSNSSINRISGFSVHYHAQVFNCPNLKEISLDFSRQENDSTDITNVVDALGRSCPKLQNIHIASFLLSHEAVLALSAANLRLGLRMLSLVLGSEITDASVAAIASSFPKLELLDLSGSSVSDSGIGMICNVFPRRGIQFAAAQLPCLELMDCGMTICDPNSEKSTDEEDNDSELQKTPNSKLHLIYQKLIIKHSRLKKLSLWGCSGLDALYLNCPHLTELNLNSCRNLHPERLLLQCGNLESVHASDCEDMLVKTIETQVYGDFAAVENHFPSATTRWLQKSPDSIFLQPSGKTTTCFYACFFIEILSLEVPVILKQLNDFRFYELLQPSDDEKKWRRPVKRQCALLVAAANQVYGVPKVASSPRLINSPCDPKTWTCRGFHPSHTVHVSSGGPLQPWPHVAVSP